MSIEGRPSAVPRRLRSFAWLALLAAAVLAVAVVPRVGRTNDAPRLVLDAHKWRLVERESGPDNYYAVSESPDGAFLHADYRPPMKTAVLGFPIPEAARANATRLRWKWRALTLPAGADECVKEKSDSAAVVYVTWKRGLRWYSVKYAWSTSVAKGTVCERKRSVFVAQDTVVLESGGPLGQWRTEEIDLASDFRRFFEKGDQGASVPPFAGVGIMSDGDQTQTPSSADYGGFVLGGSGM